MMFDPTASRALTLTGFDYRVMSGGGPGVFNTIEVYYVTDRSTFVGKELNSALWTLLGRQTVETTQYPPPIHVDIGGLTIQPDETVGIYITDTDTAPTNLARTAGPLGALFTDDLVFEDRGAAIFYPFAAVFTPRVWNGTIYYDVLQGACPGDLNGDGLTDLADLGILLADFGCTP